MLVTDDLQQGRVSCIALSRYLTGELQVDSTRWAIPCTNGSQSVDHTLVPFSPYRQTRDTDHRSPRYRAVSVHVNGSACITHWNKTKDNERICPFTVWLTDSLKLPSGNKISGLKSIHFRDRDTDLFCITDSDNTIYQISCPSTFLSLEVCTSNRT